MTLAELKAQLQQEEAKVREIKRGQIIMAELPTVGGSVQNGLRPVMIISNDKANKFSPNIIAVPLTSRDKKVYLLTANYNQPKQMD
jgi:mRNA-degrading endonuclease toxin of MazEF toxin-antitoxin module